METLVRIPNQCLLTFNYLSISEALARTLDTMVLDYWLRLP
ncbi:MAG: hypothetical protein ThorAB25_28240 [Candidatus Thorarchaeota archaeon AB_25]|nr:MAG: hypothetical protein ThorAB25_28240 [Candidatus Thorarchaeota archaeon AB_25]